jgi:glutamate/tyrosine decarboxylase-like PLP-dependent enzyme
VSCVPADPERGPIAQTSTTAPATTARLARLNLEDIGARIIRTGTATRLDRVDERRLLEDAAALGIGYVESVPTREVAPSATIEELRATLDRRLSDEPTDAAQVIDELARDVDPGLAQMGSGRYFGFVIGGVLPVALAADWLTSAWDQNAGLAIPTPAATVVEEVAGRWLKELLGIPAGASLALVTGCQVAHSTALAAARNHVLAQAGHDVERDGLAGAPPIRVIAGAKRHGTIDRALRFLGLGTGSVREVRSDGQGRMVVEALRDELARESGPTIVSAQLGEVNTGACDDLNAIADATSESGAWLHVDGAFGLWAAASPSYRHLAAGVERADSWATDAHKWLNVPYDNGIAFCAHPDAHRAALGIRSAYLIHADPDAARDPVDWNPEHSRRARAFTIYAALRALGRNGVADLVDRCCESAQLLAAGLSRLPGCEILNDVVLNQVLLRFEDDETTDRVVAAVQASGEAWMGGTVWDGRRAIRISVSNWQTSEDDVERTIAAFASARADHS